MSYVARWAAQHVSGCMEGPKCSMPSCSPTRQHCSCSLMPTYFVNCSWLISPAYARFFSGQRLLEDAVREPPILRSICFFHVSHGQAILSSICFFHVRNLSRSSKMLRACWTNLNFILNISIYVTACLHPLYTLHARVMLMLYLEKENGHTSYATNIYRKQQQNGLLSSSHKWVSIGYISLHKEGCIMRCWFFWHVRNPCGCCRTPKIPRIRI